MTITINRKLPPELIHQVGEYAVYNENLGVDKAVFTVRDVVCLAAMAQEVEPLKAVCDTIRNNWTAEVESVQGELEEVKGDVRNAEAHSEKLAAELADVKKKLEEERKERERFAKTSVFYYDALQGVHAAIGGDEVFDSEGCTDEEFVEGVVNVVTELRKTNANLRVSNDSLSRMLGQLRMAIEDIRERAYYEDVELTDLQAYITRTAEAFKK